MILHLVVGYSVSFCLMQWRNHLCPLQLYMARLGQVCTHVGALLLYLETATKISGVSQCTQEKCSWNVPIYLKFILYAPISEIDFNSARNRMRTIDATSNCPNTVPPISTSTTPQRWR